MRSFVGGGLRDILRVQCSAREQKKSKSTLKWEVWRLLNTADTCEVMGEAAGNETSGKSKLGRRESEKKLMPKDINVIR